jgi:hypothetical protein
MYVYYFFRYVDELDHVAMVESGSSDSDNTFTQGGCLCAVLYVPDSITCTVTEGWFTETVTLRRYKERFL